MSLPHPRASGGYSPRRRQREWQQACALVRVEQRRRVLLVGGGNVLGSPVGGRLQISQCEHELEAITAGYASVAPRWNVRMAGLAALRQQRGLGRLAVVMRGYLKGQPLIYKANAGQYPAFAEPWHNAASMVSALLTLPVLQRCSALYGQSGVWH